MQEGDIAVVDGAAIDGHERVGGDQPLEVGEFAQERGFLQAAALPQRLARPRENPLGRPRTARLEGHGAVRQEGSRLAGAGLDKRLLELLPRRAAWATEVQIAEECGEVHGLLLEHYESSHRRVDPAQAKTFVRLQRAIAHRRAAMLWDGNPRNRVAARQPAPRRRAARAAARRAED